MRQRQEGGGRAAKMWGVRSTSQQTPPRRTPPTHLVDEILGVGVRQALAGRHDALQVAFVQLRDQVQVLKVLRLRRPGHDVHELHHVLVTPQVPQQLDLAQDALGVNQVLEHVAHALDGHLAAGDGVLSAAHEAIGALADGTQVHVSAVHAELVLAEPVRVVLAAQLVPVGRMRHRIHRHARLAAASHGGWCAR